VIGLDAEGLLERQAGHVRKPDETAANHHQVGPPASGLKLGRLFLSDCVEEPRQPEVGVRYLCPAR
jgi:hypothetical protein